MRLGKPIMWWKYRAKADPNASHSYQIPKLKLGQYTPGALLRM
jgi:hypothetical protein